MTWKFSSWHSTFIQAHNSNLHVFCWLNLSNINPLMNNLWSKTKFNRDLIKCNVLKQIPYSFIVEIIEYNTDYM